MFLDLDRFKEVNDTLGPRERRHRCSARSAQRLAQQPARAATRSPASAATSSPSCAPGLDDADDALVVARKLRAGGRVAVHAARADARGRGEHRHRASSPSTAPTSTRCSGTPTWRCTRARRRTRGVGIYSPERDVLLARPAASCSASCAGRSSRASSSSTTSRRSACETAEVVGVEALVRWQHPEQGLLAPDRFMPFAEHTGLIKPLTAVRAARGASRSCAKWQETGSTSASPSTCRRATCSTCTCPTRSGCCSARPASTPAALELEITESTILTDPVRARDDPRPAQASSACGSRSTTSAPATRRSAT